MARLIPRSRHAAARDTRGQFLLIGAFGIAVLLLVFAGVLNTVTYTENVAARGDDHPTSRDVAAFQADVRDGVDGILAHVNEDTSSYATKATRFDSNVSDWSGAVTRQYESEVTGVEISSAATDEGSRISQSTVRNLTNATVASNWTLAESVPDTRRFLLRLESGSLLAGDCATSACYELVVDDGNSTWTVAVNQSFVVVEGPSPSVSGRCAIAADPVTIDVTGGTVDGQSCPPLRFAAGLSSPYDVRYRNGDNAAGTYRLLVNRTAANVSDSDYAADSPSVVPVVYSARVRVTYQSPQLVYSNVIRVARGESNG